MPKLAAASGRSSSSRSRRHSHQENVGGKSKDLHHASLPPSSSSAPSPVSSSPPSLSISQTSSPPSSPLCGPASSPLSVPSWSQTLSLSLSPASSTVICSGPSCTQPASASISDCHPGVQHDALLEYVKGLQEVNKTLDADVAERLLQELAECIGVPAAAALVVSAGGARIIASSVKQFKSHTSRKLPKYSENKMKAGCSSGALNIEILESNDVARFPDRDYSQPEAFSIRTANDSCPDIDASNCRLELLSQGPPHSSASVPNEARRKRQRTSVDLDQEEVSREGLIVEGKENVSGPAFTSSDNQLEEKSCGGSRHILQAKQLDPSDNSVRNSSWITGAEGLVGEQEAMPEQAFLDHSCTSTGRVDQVNACRAGASVSMSVGDSVARGRTDACQEREGGRYREKDLERKHEPVVETVVCDASFGCHIDDQADTNGGIPCTHTGVGDEDFHASGLSLLPELVNTQPEMVFTTCMQDSSLVTVSMTDSQSATSSLIPLAKRRESARLKQSSGEWPSTGREKQVDGSHYLVKNNLLSSNDLDRENTATIQVDGRRSGSELCCKSDYGVEENNTKSDGPLLGKLQNKGERLSNVGKVRDSEEEERVCGVESKSERPNVLNLARSAGLADVVAAACYTLDKLVIVALEGKRSLISNKVSSLFSSAGGKRGRVVSAEIYVALTEALVEIVFLIKDDVELLCWSLDCLGSMLPPTNNERSTIDSSSSTFGPSLAPFLSSKETLDTSACKKGKAETVAVVGKGQSAQPADLHSHLQSPVQCTLADNIAVPLKAVSKSPSDVASSGTSGDGGSTICSSSGKNGNVNSSFSGTMALEAAASSVSALAAVAYTATVPMLAGKAVKAVLSAMQPCDIEARSTQAALRALSAHLSSTNSKRACDDAVTFIIAAMREFKSDPEMQMESCIALCSLNRTVSSATGHNAWSSITNSMDSHRTNLMVQRAGCGALQVLCARAGLGIAEWGTGKRPFRASKDVDREVGALALISAMLSFPEDVRIQWHGCSTLWTLVHSAGIQSVVNMVRNGAVSVVVGAMLVCRMNETVQQEGCNVLGTMARTLAENGYEIGPLIATDLRENGSLTFVSKNPESVVECSPLSVKTCGHGLTFISKCPEDIVEGSQVPVKTSGHGDMDQKGGSADDWWEALKAILNSMKAFNKSKSVQSNGTFAMGCILKGSVETIHTGCVAPSVSPLPGLPLSNSNPSKFEIFISRYRNERQVGNKLQKGLSQSSGIDSCLESASSRQVRSLACLGKDFINELERLIAIVEATMTAMREFPKVETIQVWGCSVLQQAFLAYVHYSKRVTALAISKVDVLSARLESLCFFSSQSVEAASLSTSGCAVEPSLHQDFADLKSTMPVNPSCGTFSPADALSNLVLSQATSAMCMISGTMALSYSGSVTTGGQSQSKVATSLPLKMLSKLTGSKSLGLKSQNSSSSQSLVSVRQSWCAALGAIGDVFGHLTRIAEVSMENNSPSIWESLDSPICSGHINQAGNGMDLTNARKPSGVPSEDAGDFGGFTLCPDLKVRVDNLSQMHKEREREGLQHNMGNPQRLINKGHEKSTLSGYSEECVQGLARKDLTVVDIVPHNETVNEIRAWQEATESVAKIAERAGFQMSVKNSILAIRTVLYKLDDADTVIWACHALIRLYLTWENVHLIKPEVEIDRETYKSKIWGEGDVGVRQLVDLVSCWTVHNRPDVISLALQALYSACVFAATVHEIEEVFNSAGCGTETVLGAMQRALGSTGSLHHRRKVVQQSCCVLTAVCGYSICAQVAFASAGGADLILAAIDRFDDDGEILVNGLHALGMDSRLQPDFDALWNLAIHRNTPCGATKGGRRKRAGLSSSTFLVGLSHIYKEGVGLPCNSGVSSADCNLNVDDISEIQDLSRSRWTPELERLVFDGTVKMGFFRTCLIAGPGCGGPLFAIELLRRLNFDKQNPSLVAEIQAQVCLVIGCMSAQDSKYRQEFLDAGAIEAVLASIESVCGGRYGKFSVFQMANGVEMVLDPIPELSKANGNDSCPESKMRWMKQEDRNTDLGLVNGLDAPVQCAACWALAGLVKDNKGSFITPIFRIIQTLATTLYRYGGLPHLDLHVSRAEKVHHEVCAPARLALARLGVLRIGDRGKYLVHEAAEAGDIISVEALASKGVNLLITDEFGHTALWYAEQYGQIKVLQYLQDYAQSQGRKKSRAKAKAKSKKRMQKDVSLTDQKQSLEEKLQVEEETGPEQRPKKMDKNVLKKCIHHVSSINGFQDEAECVDRCTVSVEESKDGTNLNTTQDFNNSDAAVGVICSIPAGINTEYHQSRVAAEQKPHLAQDKRLDKVNKKYQGPQHKRRGEPTTRLLKEPSGICVNDSCLAVKAEDNMVWTKGENVCSGQDQSGLIAMNAEKANSMLRDAMHSGVVEKLEAALHACEEPGCGADKDLVKNVKMALLKRLKRKEKSFTLQEELSAAVSEGASYRLRAAILAIESVPRFAAACKEKVAAAKHLLCEIEGRERMLEKEEAQAACKCGGLDEKLPMLKVEDDMIGHDDGDHLSLGSFLEEGENTVIASAKEEMEVQNSDRRPCRVVQTSRRHRENDARAVVGLQSAQEDVFSCNRLRRERGSSGRSHGVSSLQKHASCTNSGPMRDLGQGSTRILRRKGSCTAVAHSEPVYYVSSGQKELPPLLPTPDHVEAIPVSCEVSSSVIKPPHRKYQSSSLPVEHNPITPQLFPVPTSASLGFECNEVGKGKLEGDAPVKSASLENLTSDPLCDSGLLHISQLFPSSLPSPQLFTFRDCVGSEVCPSDSLDEHGASASGSFASLLASIFPSHLCGAATTSTTLFSTSFDKSFFVSSTETPFLNTTIGAPVTSSEQTLNSQSHSSLPTRETIMSGSVPAFVQRAVSSTHDKGPLERLDFQKGCSLLPQSSSLFPGSCEAYRDSSFDTRMFSDINRCAAYALDSQAGSCPGPTDLSILSQARLQQVALMDAFMEDCCCICFDKPKDAALIPCGHRMCKGCAEEIRRIRHFCPICNRLIEAVLALFG